MSEFTINFQPGTPSWTPPLESYEHIDAHSEQEIINKAWFGKPGSTVQNITRIWAIRDNFERAKLYAWGPKGLQGTLPLPEEINLKESFSLKIKPNGKECSYQFVQDEKDVGVDDFKNWTGMKLLSQLPLMDRLSLRARCWGRSLSYQQIFAATAVTLCVWSVAAYATSSFPFRAEKV